MTAMTAGHITVWAVALTVFVEIGVGRIHPRLIAAVAAGLAAVWAVAAI